MSKDERSTTYRPRSLARPGTCFKMRWAESVMCRAIQFSSSMDRPLRIDPRMDPFARPIGPVFLLPDGNVLFDRVNQPLPRLESRLAMRRADRNGNACLSQFQSP